VRTDTHFHYLEWKENYIWACVQKAEVLSLAIILSFDKHLLRYFTCAIGFCDRCCHADDRKHPDPFIKDKRKEILRCTQDDKIH